MENKEELINRIMPDELKPHLKDWRYMTIGHSIYKATAKVYSLRNSSKSSREYYIDFIEVPKEFVKDATGSDQYVRDLYQNYNYDYRYPIPCNLISEYEYVADNLIWNEYKRPVHEGKFVKDNADFEKRCKTTIAFFKHIYGDKLELALDYLTIEFMLPTHPLPVQVLYSRENNTGKTTVLNHRRMIYGHNAAIIDSGTFGEKFNGTIMGKNYIGIDEGKLNGEEGIEKLKALVTNPTIQHRAMRKDHVEMPNFGKWAIATNKDNWAKLDSEDTRFWVIKVNKIKGDFDKDFEKKLKNEIPYLIGFLQQRFTYINNTGVSGFLKMKYTKSQSRLWFPYSAYFTEEFEAAQRNSRSLYAKAFLDEIIYWFEEYNKAKPPVDKIRQMFSITKKLRDGLHNLPIIITSPLIKRILEKDLSLKPMMNKAGTNLSNHRYTDYFATSPNPNAQNTGAYLLNYDDLVYMRDGIRMAEAEETAEDADANKKDPVQKNIKHKK